MKRQRTAAEGRAGKRAVAAMGGPVMTVKLVKQVLGKEVSRPAVYKWERKGVPPEWADDVYNLSGVGPWITNPSVFKRRYNSVMPVMTVRRKAIAFLNKHKGKTTTKKRVAKKKPIKVVKITADPVTVNW